MAQIDDIRDAIRDALMFRALDEDEPEELFMIWVGQSFIAGLPRGLSADELDAAILRKAGVKNLDELKQLYFTDPVAAGLREEAVIRRITREMGVTPAAAKALIEETYQKTGTKNPEELRRFVEATPGLRALTKRAREQFLKERHRGTSRNSVLK